MKRKRQKNKLMFTPAPLQDQIPTPLPQENQQQPEAKKEPVKKEVTPKDNVGSFVKNLNSKSLNRKVLSQFVDIIS